MKTTVEWVLVTVVPTVVIIAAGVTVYVLLNRSDTDTDDKTVTDTSTCVSDDQCLNQGVCLKGVCQCADNWTGANCGLLSSAPSTSTSVNCSTSALPCDSNDDCSKCTSSTSINYTCQQVDSSDNNYALNGQYCLPSKPDESVCRENECDPETNDCSGQMPGDRKSVV